VNEGEVVTEYGVPYKSGDVKIRSNEPDVEEVYPLAQWIGHHAPVLRRRIIVVEDWTEVTEP
jgi:hypothetical protein